MWLCFSMQSRCLACCWDFLGTSLSQLSADTCGKTCLLIPIGIRGLVGWPKVRVMGCRVRWAPGWCYPLPGCRLLSSHPARPQCQGSALATRYSELSCWKLDFSLAARQIGHKHSPWSLLVFFCGGRYPHLPSRGALPSVVPPLLPCWLPQLHHHLWGSALDPGAAGHPPAGMVKEMGDSEQPSGVNLWGERGQRGSAWSVAGIIQVEERWRSCWPGRTGGDASIRREQQALALPRAAEEMAERGLRLHHPAWIQSVKGCLERQLSSSSSCSSSSSRNWPLSFHASCWWV